MIHMPLHLSVRGFSILPLALFHPLYAAYGLFRMRNTAQAPLAVH
ncbi:hypothetical protein SAMN04487959_114130 [Modicisalibacter xianhensis]|uniref:Uncharacterized protein n=1 Tax=Modicisalibacter xianhensis TaxID=442341 RepID=A0A1I3ERD2_9GAMM|nr:hypothetical protein SAMN04487959_114130 [Halomonas xianhensis]